MLPVIVDAAPSARPRPANTPTISGMKPKMTNSAMPESIVPSTCSLAPEGNRGLRNGNDRMRPKLWRLPAGRRFVVRSLNVDPAAMRAAGEALLFPDRRPRLQIVHADPRG